MKQTAIRLRRGLGLTLLLAGALVVANPTYVHAGEPTVQIEHDPTADAMRVRGSIDIAAPPAIVWAVLSDCDRAPRVVPNMESCRIVQRDPAGHWDMRETVLNIALLPRIRSLMRNEYESGRRLVFKRIGGDMRISDGEWRIEPIAKGKATRLHYEALFATTMLVPQFLIDQAAARDFPTFFRNIEQESLADAANK
jgi:carbon monoxide dehydrogenase subunit G